MMIEYHAARLAGCIRAQVAERLGYAPLEPPEKMQQVFEAGERAEEEVIAQLSEEGYVVHGQQSERTFSVSGEVRVVCHPDGFIDEWPDDEPWLEQRVLEVKSCNNDAYEAWSARGWETPGLVQKYKWQVSCYMVATGLEALVVVKNRDDPSAPLLRFGVEVPFYSLEEIRARVLEIESHVQAGVVGTAPCTLQYPCPYYYLHDEEDRELLTDPEIDALARAQKTASQSKKAAEDHYKELNSQLKEALGGAGKYETSSGVKVTVSKVKNTDRYDIEGMKKRFGKEAVEEFMQPSGTHERVNVTLPEG